jgi:hypothetical protein
MKLNLEICLRDEAEDCHILNIYEVAFAPYNLTEIYLGYPKSNGNDTLILYRKVEEILFRLCGDSKGETADWGLFWSPLESWTPESWSPLESIGVPWSPLESWTPESGSPAESMESLESVESRNLGICRFPLG